MEDYRIALNIISGNGFSLYSSIGLTAIKGPIYPFLLSFFIKLFGNNNLVCITLFQHFLIAFTPLLLFLVGKRLNQVKAGAIASIIFIFHPSYFYYPSVIETTNIFIPLAILWLAEAIKIRNILISNSHNKKKLFTFILFGVLSGLLILLQTIVIPIIIIYICYLFFKTKSKYLFLIAASAILIISPWTVRNYIAFNKIMLVKSPFWMNVYTGYLFENNGIKNFSIIPDSTKKFISGLDSKMNDIEQEKYYKSVTISIIKFNPLLYVKKTLYQGLIYWWIPPRYFHSQSISFMIIRTIPVIVLNVFCLISIIYFFIKDKKNATLYLLVFLYFSAVYAFMHISNIRFKLDIEWLESLLIGTMLSNNNFNFFE